MPRRSKPFIIIETYTPDPARCAEALIRLLDWEPPATAPATSITPAEAPGPGEDPETAEEDPCRTLEDRQARR